ncbi:MAG: helix-turn-helix transcriptional regulator [Dehalococcoidia bacterium]|nr:helix-turn-helix transcriptional regulator [Dehalococcoidia bacterium]
MKRPELVSLGNNIRSIRMEKGISQEKLAERASIHRTYLGGVERGERNVSLINLVRISRALEVLPEVLLKGIS